MNVQVGIENISKSLDTNCSRPESLVVDLGCVKKSICANTEIFPHNLAKTGAEIALNFVDIFRHNPQIEIEQRIFVLPDR
ncbi:MAG: hypothetical protein AAF468_11480 [Pseudomonadota bacterium]